MTFGSLTLTFGLGSSSSASADVGPVTTILTGSAGSFALSGQDADLRNFKITADQASFVFAGRNATLRVTASYFVTAEQGSFTLTGQDAALATDEIVVASQGSFSMTGQNASLGVVGAYTITAEQGSFALTGYDASLLSNEYIAANQGSVTLSGQDITILRSRIMTASQGSFVMTGQSATLTYAGGSSFAIPEFSSTQDVQSWYKVGEYATLNSYMLNSGVSENKAIIINAGTLSVLTDPNDLGELEVDSTLSLPSSYSGCNAVMLTEDIVAAVETGGNRVVVLTKSGGVWSEADSVLVTNPSFYPGITRLSDAKFATADNNNDLQAYEWDGTSISTLGNSFALNVDFPNEELGMDTLIEDQRIAVFARINGSQMKIGAYDFDGTDWSRVGNLSGTYGGNGHFGVAALNSTTVAICDNASTASLRAVEFDGTDWANVGSLLNVSADVSSWPRTLTRFNSNTIGIQSFGGAKVSIYKARIPYPEGGKRLYVWARGPGGDFGKSAIFAYDGDADVGNYQYVSGNTLETTTEGTNVAGMAVDPTDTTFFRFKSDNTLKVYTASTAGDLTSLGSAVSTDLNGVSLANGAIGQIQDGWVNEDGTIMLILDATNESVHHFTMGTGWDQSTLSYVGELSGIDTTSYEDPRGITANSNISSVYILDEKTSSVIYQWNESGGSYSQDVSSVALGSSLIFSIQLIAGGKRILFASYGGQEIGQVDMTTAEDLSTASVSSSALDVSSEAAGPNTCWVNGY